MWTDTAKKLIMCFTLTYFLRHARTSGGGVEAFAFMSSSSSSPFIRSNHGALFMLPHKRLWTSVMGGQPEGENAIQKSKSSVEMSTASISSAPVVSFTSADADADAEASNPNININIIEEISLIAKTAQEELEEKAKEIKKHIGSKLYDITGHWGDDQAQQSDFLKGLFLPKGPGDEDGDDDSEKENKKKKNSNKGNQEEPNNFISLIGIMNGDSPSKKEIKEEAAKLHDSDAKDAASGTAKIKTMRSLEQMSSSFIGLITGRNASHVEDFVVKARELTQGEAASKSTIGEVLDAAQTALKGLDKTMTAFFGDAGLPSIYPSNVYYWIEHEEERKNFSWKRRKHRFCPSLDIGSVEELDRKLHFANLCYGDSLEDIQEELENEFGYELLYCNMEGQTNQPSHFIAVKRDQPIWSNALEVTLMIRGTKTLTDVITDILCDEVPYRGGTAHSGVLESAQFIAEKHRQFFKQLCELSGKSKIKLTLIGHSLGAGVAAIVGMELNDEDYIEADVYGFGAPAILSKEVSESTKDFVTTIVADNDVVPRLSAATTINALLDMSEHDWIPGARRDMEDALSHIHNALPLALSESNKERMKGLIDNILLGSAEIPKPTTKRMTPTLFPPGECVHFYRDGFGMSAVKVPCDFFSELDISRRSIEDHHYYFGYKQVFLELMRQHHRNHFFTFETDRLLKKMDSMG